MDKARAWTDKELAKMEKRLRRMYIKSYNDMTSKWYAYMEKSNKELAPLQKAYEEAKEKGDKDLMRKTGIKLSNAKKEQTLMNSYYKDMVNQTATNITNVNQTAVAYMNGELPKVASINYNQLAAEADKVGVAFNLVDEHTVMKMLKDNDIKLPRKKINPAKDIPWNTKKLNSAVLQGILQGESMDKIAKRIKPIIGQNSDSAIRNARTMVTGAENAGRQASYKELENKGAVMKKVWIATGDGRTRESHLELDGEEIGIDDTFSNGLEYPGDPGGDPAEVYNCRCTMESHITGFRDSKTGKVIEIDYERQETRHDKEIEREKERRKEAEKETGKENTKPKAQMDESMMKLLRSSRISKLEVNKLSKPLSSTEIINRLCGGDLTKGSCSSLAYAYIGNKHGYDVLDFRGGRSLSFFSSRRNVLDIDSPLKESTRVLELTEEASDLAKKLKELDLPYSKEYKLTCGKHAAIIRNTENGYEYLELQSPKQNGWKPFTYKEKLYEGTEYEQTHTVSMAETLYNRFGCKKVKMGTKYAQLVDVDAYKDLDGFDEMLSYINTKKGAQKKGIKGTIK